MDSAETPDVESQLRCLTSEKSRPLSEPRFPQLQMETVKPLLLPSQGSGAGKHTHSLCENACRARPSLASVSRPGTSVQLVVWPWGLPWTQPKEDDHPLPPTHPEDFRGHLPIFSFLKLKLPH